MWQKNKNSLALRNKERSARWVAAGLLLAIVCCAEFSHADMADAEALEPPGGVVVPANVAAEVPSLAHETPSIESAGAVADSEGIQEGLDVTGDERSVSDRFWLNYFSIYYGSSVASPSKYQTSPSSAKDPSKPQLLKNFLTLGYNLNDKFAVAGTGYFTWSAAGKDQVQIQDPSVRIANSSIASFNGFNWYGDARVHFAVSSPSRNNDMLTGLQTFHFFSYQAEGSHFMTGLYASLRYNIFGNQGVGNDVDLYFAPTANYELSQKLSLTLLYELGSSHTYGNDAGLESEGQDLQPGVLWKISPGFELNPYLNIYTGGKVSTQTTAFGATLSWAIL